MAEASSVRPVPMNRREFLFYIWGASMALTMAGTAGALLWYAYPRFREGEFGGRFVVPVSAVPNTTAPPSGKRRGPFLAGQHPAGGHGDLQGLHPLRMSVQVGACQ